MKQCGLGVVILNYNIQYKPTDKIVNKHWAIWENHLSYILQHKLRFVYFKNPSPENKLAKNIVAHVHHG